MLYSVPYTVCKVTSWLAERISNSSDSQWSNPHPTAPLLNLATLHCVLHICSAQTILNCKVYHFLRLLWLIKSESARKTGGETLFEREGERGLCVADETPQRVCVCLVFIVIVAQVHSLGLCMFWVHWADLCSELNHSLLKYYTAGTTRIKLLLILKVVFERMKLFADRHLFLDNQPNSYESVAFELVCRRARSPTMTTRPSKWMFSSLPCREVKILRERIKEMGDLRWSWKKGGPQIYYRNKRQRW